MEHVEAILYHKIQDSDFTNMYGVKKPKSGGGQTYIQAAGYSRADLDNMFKDANSIFDTPEFWDKEKVYPRKRYTFETYEVGNPEKSNIELSPRTGRKDYRISRQNVKYRHPAWQASHGFPEPRKSGVGIESIYKYEKNYPGLIDNLFILIIKTRDDSSFKYYATYVVSKEIPLDWPTGAGLENIFVKNKHQGIIFYTDQFLRYVDNKSCPFQAGSAADNDIGSIPLPENLCETPDDAVEYANKDINISIDYRNIAIRKVEAPSNKKKPRYSEKRPIPKDTDYERRHRNLKRIGDIGEELAIAIEKRCLLDEGQTELAEKVEQVSKTIGDGLGYDIRSYEKLGEKYIEKFIEVKSTTGGKNKPFDISSNEVNVSSEKGDQYYIYRFFGVGNNMTEAQYYEVKGSVSENFSLEPTVYKAYCKK